MLLNSDDGRYGGRGGGPGNSSVLWRDGGGGCLGVGEFHGKIMGKWWEISGKSTGFMEIDGKMVGNLKVEVHLRPFDSTYRHT